MNVFVSALCDLATDTKSGVGVRISLRTPTIAYQYFAYGGPLFCKTKLSLCMKLKHIIDEFYKLFGQLINFLKSSVVVSKNTANSQKQTVAVIFNIPHRKSLGKYLGCTIFEGKSKSSSLIDILGKATVRMESWKASSLSKACRAVLIQSNMESLPSHTL